MVTDDLRALDAKVHRAVYGEGWNGGNPIKGFDGRWPWPPPYSTNIEAAWRVVESLRSRGSPFCMLCADLEPSSGWVAWFGSYFDKATTVPLAICRAALKAIEAQPVPEVS